ncbi:MAG: hypothetical protein J6Y93_04600 [Treponema sp.]|nr:hypothetical protein [Treponema sp.]
MNAPVSEYGNGKDELSLESFPYPHKIVHNPSVKISSSQVRQRTAQKKSFRYLVTEKVFEYILNEHLYER